LVKPNFYSGVGALQPFWFMAAASNIGGANYWWQLISSDILEATMERSCGHGVMPGQWL
jgi:hypothetical protein